MYGQIFKQFYQWLVREDNINIFSAMVQTPIFFLSHIHTQVELPSWQNYLQIMMAWEEVFSAKFQLMSEAFCLIYSHILSSLP